MTICLPARVTVSGTTLVAPMKPATKGELGLV